MGFFNRRRKEKGRERGSGGSCSPASTSTEQVSASTPVSASIVPPALTPPSGRAGLSAECLSAPPSASNSLDLWKLAYDKFREDEPDLVSGYETHVLSSASGATDLSNRESIEEALKKLLEDRENKQWKVSILSHNVNIRAQVIRLTKLLKWSDPLVKSAISAQPYAALAWSGVSMLLPLLTSGTTENEAMLEGFGSIGELQKFWVVNEKISLHSTHHQHYQNLIEPLIKLYSLLFAYQAHVICHLSKRQSSRAWSDLSSPGFWTGKMEDINKSNETCCTHIVVSREGEIQENRDSLLQEMHELQESNERHIRDEKETHLLRDLAKAAGDYERYKDLNPKRVPGTCEWFLADERFRKWRDNASSSLLWVSAGPGRGKSVLSRSLIDEDQLAITTVTITPSSNKPATSRQSTVCYFFFKDGGDGRMDSSQALCALLHQLFTNPYSSGLIKYALESRKKHGETLTEKVSELWKILLDCVTAPDSGEIICVLDALDESKSGQELIRTLEEFYSQSVRLMTDDSRLKFLVTSRPYDNLEKSFKRFPEAVYMRFDGDDKSKEIQKEINLVIDARVPSITTDFAPEDQQKVSEHLKSMEHRTYLWLHLTLDIIEKSPSDYGRWPDIETLLSHLPSQVSDAYEKILSKSKNPSRTRVILQIILAAKRPLTLDEVNVALTLATREQEPESYSKLDSELWPKNSFKSIITNLCGLFVSVYDSKLSFIHQTAREFLMDSEPEGKWKGCFNMPQSHGALSRLCIFHLLLPDVDGPVVYISARYPFLAYAAKFWPLHFTSQDPANANAICKHARRLCDTASHQAGIWIPYCIRHVGSPHLGYRVGRYAREGGWTDLALAAYLGLRGVVESILLENPNVDLVTKGNGGGTALSMAARRGHEAIIELLLRKGANIDAKDNDGSTPLLRAAKGGHWDSLMLLLERGANIETWDDHKGNTALSRAAEQGHEAIVKLLLEKGADIESGSRSYSNYDPTLLLPAAGQGYKAYKDRVFRNILKTMKRGNVGLTPLLAAAEKGHRATVELLLEKGAKIEAQDNFGQTPLLVATGEATGEATGKGYKAIMELLLEKGAKIDAQDNVGQTPLLVAAEKGHRATVELLLEKGAKIEAQDNVGQTPLLVAAENGHWATVELLLEKGAKIEAQDNFGQTPLLLAAEHWQEAAVKILLKNGADKGARDQDERTPLSIATEEGHEAIVKLLAEAKSTDLRDNTQLLPDTATRMQWVMKKPRDAKTLECPKTAINEMMK